MPASPVTASFPVLALYEPVSLFRLPRVPRHFYFDIVEAASHRPRC
jgi:hypothetical protein